MEKQDEGRPMTCREAHEFKQAKIEEARASALAIIKTLSDLAAIDLMAAEGLMAGLAKAMEGLQQIHMAEEELHQSLDRPF